MSHRRRIVVKKRAAEGYLYGKEKIMPEVKKQAARGEAESNMVWIGRDGQ